MLRLTASAERVFLGWGLFDAIYIARYLVFSVIAGKIPYIDDFNRGIELLADHGMYARILSILVWGVELSIVLSCILFLGRWRAARVVAWVQMPFRLIFVIPSVSILFIGLDIKERYGIGLMLLLLLLSECLKGWTLWTTRKCSLAR